MHCLNNRNVRLVLILQLQLESREELEELGVDGPLCVVNLHPPHRDVSQDALLLPCFHPPSTSLPTPHHKISFLALRGKCIIRTSRMA